MSKKELSKTFQNILAKNPEWPMVLDVVRQCTAGKIWLFGGYVYRNLAGRLYGIPVLRTDYDFATEVLRPTLNLLGFVITKTSLGSPRLNKDDLQIEIIQLSNFVTIKRRGLEPTIENCLAGTPLTIQSIAYDIDDGVVLGDAAIQRLLTKVVFANNREELDVIAKLSGITVEEYTAKKLPDGFVYMP